MSPVSFDPAVTSTSWQRMATVNAQAELSEVLGTVDWAHFLVLSLRHRLSGLAHDALVAADLFDFVPVAVAEQLRYQTELTASRRDELVGALAELAELEPEVVSRTVLLKGGALLTEYAQPSHRPMSDFDLLFSSEDFLAVEPAFEKLGYWRKESLNGPTYYRDRTGPGGPLCLDVHVAGPSKYWRPESALTAWFQDSEPHTIEGIVCRRLSPELELLNIVTHIHEHLGSWIHALADDDLALVRLVDVELLVARRNVDVARCWALAIEHDLHGEFALGLWVQSRLRHGLPGPLGALTPLVGLVEGLGELVAVPGGALVEWPVPLAERMYLTDRLGLAYQVLEVGLPNPERIEVSDARRVSAWREWYRHLGTRRGYRENVESIGSQARERLTEFNLTYQPDVSYPMGTPDA